MPFRLTIPVFEAGGCGCPFSSPFIPGMESEQQLSLNPRRRSYAQIILSSKGSGSEFSHPTCAEHSSESWKSVYYRTLAIKTQPTPCTHLEGPPKPLCNSIINKLISMSSRKHSTTLMLNHSPSNPSDSSFLLLHYQVLFRSWPQSKIRPCSFSDAVLLCLRL